ncbi:MAG: YIP1 family protein [Pseudomonadota bacterium]
MVNLIIDTLSAPRAALSQLRERAPLWPPLLLVIGSATLLSAVYFNVVDPEFLTENILAQAGDDLSLEEERRIREFASDERPAGRWFPALGTAISTTVLLLLQSGYYTLVSMLAGFGVRARQWLALVAWTSLPSVLAPIAGLTALALAPGFELPLTDLNPLSFSSLLNLEPRRGALRLLGEIDLTLLWAFALQVLGVHLWTGSGWEKSLLIAGAPYLLLGGIALAVAA